MAGDKRSILKHSSFFDKVALLSEAAADTDTVTPAYIYQEIANLTFESESECQDLVEFTCDRLKNDSSLKVRFKILKLLKFTVTHGHATFRDKLRRLAGPILQECTKCGGPPHPIHGMAPYHSIRHQAEELIKLLFATSRSLLQELIKLLFATSEADFQSMLPAAVPVDKGIGNVTTTAGSGSLHGFGNSPQQQPASMSDSFVGGVKQMAESLFVPSSAGTAMTSARRQRSAADAADRNFGRYEAVHVTSTTSHSDVTDATTGAAPLKDSTRALKQHESVAAPARTYRKGVAGGGWADDSDDDVGDVNDAVTSAQAVEGSAMLVSLSSQSGQIQADLCSSQSSSADMSQEQALVEQYVQPSNAVYIKHSDIQAFINRSQEMNCVSLLNVLNKHMTSSDSSDDVRMRCLLLLEAMLRTDFTAASDVSTTCAESLHQLQSNAVTSVKVSKILQILKSLTATQQRQTAHET